MLASRSVSIAFCLAIWFGLSLQKCYDTDGSVVGNNGMGQFVECPFSGQCCVEGDSCWSGGFCYSSAWRSWYRGMCSDSSWSISDCATACLTDNGDNFLNTCPNGEWCCAGGGGAATDCCGDSFQATIELQDIPAESSISITPATVTVTESGSGKVTTTTDTQSGRVTTTTDTQSGRVTTSSYTTTFTSLITTVIGGQTTTETQIFISVVTPSAAAQPSSTGGAASRGIGLEKSGGIAAGLGLAFEFIPFLFGFGNGL